MADETVSSAARAAIHSLVLDAALPEIIAALDADAIPSILLKGRTILDRLYDPGESRPYVDIDLLVPPSRHREALTALGALGFVDRSSHRDVLRSADLHRATDNACIDLHFTLWGPRIDPEIAFWNLHAATDKTVISAATVRRLNDAGLALELCFHALHSAPAAPKPLDDLTRGVERLPETAWRGATELAAQLRATCAMAAGLRRVPKGVALADRLGLPDLAPERANAVAYAHLASRRRSIGRIGRLVFPSPDRLKMSSGLANRGPAGLAAAYVSRPFVLIGRAALARRLPGDRR